MSISLTNHVRFTAADLGNFSASLFAPTPQPSPIPLRLAPSNSTEEIDDFDSNDSGVETEPEFLNEAQLTELAQRFPSNSNMPEAVAIEVRLFFFFLFCFDL